ncbi:hypothetical protein [Mesoplasma lactucae]|uniref:Uncharacterized protein n=1 Tax=Mesoplasma lactucae ATCC 49193 TaxID=81460 RepID=A0A291IS82_9MOLU|nr:hypothetical protein [Mesoplasma lactucae]ATG97551.1 hypothetical protein CP520_02175 [Mesoplasma lactucae ATCC 49193]ATZ19990.1 hypothetical protein MLACT_v1c01680 [Mesoplasma lactucae ATCC 49193]MCL8217059.1 hypothetical protein [Mesoplasma lactucae ATCC 49193]
MIERLGSQTAAIVIIFMVFLGIILLFQIFGKLFFQIKGHFSETSVRGEETFNELRGKELLNSKVKTKKGYFLPTFYSYHKKKDEFIIPKAWDKENLLVNMNAIQAIIFADEKRRRAPFFRLQYIGLSILSLIPYAIFLVIMILTFVPKVDVNGRVPMGAWISVEALCIIGWVIMLLGYFWWINVTQKFGERIEELAEETLDKNLGLQLKNYMNAMSYIPYSIRMLI